ncbi:MAG: tRNA adenosine(34) deaminase TadA, partial [Desulfovibrio sp.]|nr:tRNA adenosine(34) deaminase TadA [Desulfovibrio sp.]
MSRILPPPPGVWPSWEALMAEALAEAVRAAARAETPVGAVLVSPSGALLGRGHNVPERSHDPTAHAEIRALRQAGRRTGNYRLRGAVLVVTLEPCLMCVGAMIQARIAGLVYGAADPAAGAADSCLEGFAQPFLPHRIWHLGGVEQDRCSALLREFFVRRRSFGAREAGFNPQPA